MSQLDMDERRCTVLGKGNKMRQIYFGRNANRALRHYLRKRRHFADTSVFLGERGPDSSEGLCPNGLRQLIQRLGHAAGLQAVRCSPHTFRHTFAIEFLRAGGNQFSLKEMLGHTTLHRQFSPADRLAYSLK